LYVFVAVAALAAACTVSNETDWNVGRVDVPVQFDTYLSGQAETRAGYAGVITDTELKGTWDDDANAATVAVPVGFGVFAYYTGDAGYGSTATSPNFMYNQQVAWNDALDDGYITKWAYDPVKYWPNDFSTGAVDDQDNDASDNPATGSGLYGGKVSFFAYAPYVSAVSGTQGIVDMSGNGYSGDPYVDYQLGGSYRLAKDNVDLLWGVATADSYKAIAGQSSTTEGMPMKDLTKPLVNEAVRFKLLHATSMLRVLVVGAFDEVNPGNNEVDGETRILVNRVKMEMASPMKARLNLNNTAANTPRWMQAEETPSTFSFDLTKDATEERSGASVHLMNTAIHYWDGTTAYADLSAPNADTKTYLGTAGNFDLLPLGVTKADQNLLNLPAGEDENDYGIMFIPATTTSPVDEVYQTLNAVNVNINYDVITRDESLVRNTPAGFSIIANDISRTLTLPSPYTFEAGKQYTLRMILGLTTVKFEVVAVDEWGTAITLAPMVKEWVTETVEANVE